jgi:hypothetical protein
LFQSAANVLTGRRIKGLPTQRNEQRYAGLFYLKVLGDVGGLIIQCQFGPFSINSRGN